MADLEERIYQVDEKINDLERRHREIINAIERRQDSFESKMDMYILKTDEQIRLQREDMKRLEGKLDNLLIAGGIGIATIVVTILLSR